MSDENTIKNSGSDEQTGESPESQKPGTKSKTIRLDPDIADGITDKAKAMGITQGMLVEQMYHIAETQQAINQVPGEKESIDDFVANLNHLQTIYTDLVDRYGSLKANTRQEYQRSLSEKDLKIQSLRQEAEEARAAAKAARADADDCLTRMLKAESEARRSRKETEEIRTMVQETSRLNALLEEKITTAEQKLRGLEDMAARESELTRRIVDLEHALKEQKISFEHSLELQKRDAAFEKAESLRVLERELTEDWQGRCVSLSSQNAALQARLEFLLAEREAGPEPGADALATRQEGDDDWNPEDLISDLAEDDQPDDEADDPQNLRDIPADDEADTAAEEA